MPCASPFIKLPNRMHASPSTTSGKAETAFFRNGTL
jgi:hypothetical protein